MDEEEEGEETQETECAEHQRSKNAQYHSDLTDMDEEYNEDDENLEKKRPKFSVEQSQPAADTQNANTKCIIPVRVFFLVQNCATPLEKAKNRWRRKRVPGEDEVGNVCQHLIDEDDAVFHGCMSLRLLKVKL
ncbi:hypothetical protein HDV05_008275 [Chytridiales sp. JEL 0842]|nr:hypothetical protein HDV05_008275 [Chytridiales sp. JEL 0842]